MSGWKDIPYHWVMEGEFIRGELEDSYQGEMDTP